ncbi:NAD(P)/FAD-dependent oxidoreductase [Streptomyces bauhiniae]|uniref:NAD(P)/FAD-dependent oxidoreductase n=1 Tax=Streptomyces bauhiniae TaxID=2340725 RepID=A0A7K3QKH8_9ACTN|nr:FAD-dependent oxidoreductase [Streptomyces bauhiniae]NEB90385.1 NAD(P)/FAD-dependent oxidoreductase [Streptomyces bauhiniae]
MRSRRIAVVGAGMAAARLAQQLAAHAGPTETVLHGAEPPYNRTLLADVLAGRYRADALALPTGDAKVRTGSEVVAVDVRDRALTLADGSRETYDELVLATGAEPVRPFTGGGYTLRSLADVARISRHADTATRAVVIGGGVLGVGTARALAARGLPVNIVHKGPHLIDRHLDSKAGDTVHTTLARLGVTVDLASTPDTHITPTSADLVVHACGVRPRTALARAAGLPVRRGIVVDDTLACAPHTYAIGDCAEHRAAPYALATTAWEQADVLAARLSGADPEARYTGSRPMTRLTAGPVEYAAFGACGDAAEEGADVLRIGDATRGAYKKLVLRGDRIVGAILVGDLATAGTLTRAYLTGRPVGPDPLSLLTAPLSHRVTEESRP